MSATASSSISATVTITIGSKTVTLDSSDLGSLQKPQVFNLPEGGINFTTQEVIDWVNATFGTSLAVPTSITDLVQANISMEDLYMTSVKDFRTDVSLTFQSGQSFAGSMTGMELWSVPPQVQSTVDPYLVKFSLKPYTSDQILASQDKGLGGYWLPSDADSTSIKDRTTTNHAATILKK